MQKIEKMDRRKKEKLQKNIERNGKGRSQRREKERKKKKKDKPVKSFKEKRIGNMKMEKEAFLFPLQI